MAKFAATFSKTLSQNLKGSASYNTPNIQARPINCLLQPSAIMLMFYSFQFISAIVTCVQMAHFSGNRKGIIKMIITS